MALLRPRAYLNFRVIGTTVVVGSAFSAGISIPNTPGLAVDILRTAATIALFVVVIILLGRIESARRQQQAQAGLGEDLHEIRDAVSQLAADVHRLDEGMEILAARSMRIARVLEEETAAPNGEITGEIIRLPRHRGSKARIS